MNPILAEHIAKAEAEFGDRGLLYILQQGIAAYGDALNEFRAALLGPESEFSCNAIKLIKAIDPDSGILFNAGPEGKEVHCVGKLKSGAREALETEFNRIADRWPFIQSKINLKLTFTEESVSSDQ